MKNEEIACRYISKKMLTSASVILLLQSTWAIPLIENRKIYINECEDLKWFWGSLLNVTEITDFESRVIHQGSMGRGASRYPHRDPRLYNKNRFEIYGNKLNKDCPHDVDLRMLIKRCFNVAETSKRRRVLIGWDSKEKLFQRAGSFESGRSKTVCLID